MSFSAREVGITLVELLVVLVIVGLLASLVSPVMYRQIEKGQAETEFMNLRAHLQSISTAAFARGRPVQVQLQDQMMSWSVTGLSSRAITFRHLKFEPQMFTVSKNGLSDRETVSVDMAQGRRDVALNEFLTAE